MRLLGNFKAQWQAVDQDSKQQLTSHLHEDQQQTTQHTSTAAVLSAGTRLLS
jgi:hypothetical protein